MHQRPSDLYAQLLRTVGVYGAEFTFSDVRTRHAALLRFYDTFLASDSAVIGVTSLSLEQAGSLDAQLYTFKVGLKGYAPASDAVTFLFGSTAHSDGVASDSVAVGLRYFIDCFFGGLSFGGSPFGGRIV